MQDILSESLRKLRKIRVRKTRMIAVVLALSLVVSLDVFWWLRQPGLTLAGDADCGIVEHTHDDSCQGTETPCNLIEHIHDISCYSDDTADLETQLDWQKMFADYPYTGNLRSDLVGIAKTQVGYTESVLNFHVSSDGVRRGYTRYSAWYGAPYSDWSATFVSFCLHYAGANQHDFPYNTGADSMAEQWKKLGKFALAGNYKPTSGDLIFFKDNTVGIVTEVLSTTCYVIRGDIENSVQSSIISFTDEAIIGWGTVGQCIEKTELYDISNGPAVYLFANGQKDMQPQTYTSRRLLRNTPSARDLIEYLNQNGGGYIFTLLDANDHPVAKDENGNYIVHSDELYKITITMSSPDGFSDGVYTYNFPSEVRLVSVGDDRFIINETTDVGSWSVDDETNLMTFNFNENVNQLYDVIISATVGVIFPKEMQEIDFDGKIHITIEPPREEILVTDVNKWGIQGDPENIDVINKTDKLDPSKIYWTVQIEGNQQSQIPGSVISDRVLKHDWSYEHYYTESDIARGLKFGVSVYDPETGSDVWHSWTVTTDDPALTWDANGWSYTVPERVICNKNNNSPHELVLGNNNWTYFVEYSSTPIDLNLAGERGYVNEITVENKTTEGWGGFTHIEVEADIYKNGTIVTDASGAKILWEIMATIPKMTPGSTEHDWVITDTSALYTEQWGVINGKNNEIQIASITANYFGTTINVPHFSVATENDPYAYYDNYWNDNMAVGLTIMKQCVCTEDTCGEWSHEKNRCNPWVYEDDVTSKVTNYCDCWTETEDTTFTIVYSTDVTDEIEEYGGTGAFAYNYADIYTSYNFGNFKSDYVTIPLPGIVSKEDHELEGTIVKYSITVNEGKLNLTDGKPLIIRDEMTHTLAFMRGSLVIKSQDALGNEVILTEDVDYTYTYDGSGDAVDENGKPILGINGEPVHILEVEIKHPQPVTYFLDYNTSLIMPKVEKPEDLKSIYYTNSAKVYLWGGSASDSSSERVFPNINIASNAFSVFVHKLSALDNTKYLAGAEFGLFNEQGGLITKGITGEDGRLYFRTDVKNGIVLREHKIYYIKELTAPPGYKLDDTIHEFTFCSNADGTCDIYNDLKEEHDLTRVPFDTVGHIDVTIDVTNEPAYYDLPATGGVGTYPLILVSVIFIVIPLVYIFVLWRRRRRKVTDNFLCFASATNEQKIINERTKIMKKLVSILLALVLTLALSISAFAANATVTIGNDADRAYVGFKLMSLTTSLKAYDACAEGTPHNKDCYNYAYTINPDFATILKTATRQDTDEGVFEYLTDANTDVQATANAIYRAIKDAGINGTAIKGNNATELEQGYWLFADVTDLDGHADKANSVVMLKTQGQENITVTPKLGLPTVTKLVKDVNDTTADNGWDKSADLDIGDYAEFKLTATVHERLASYKTYKLIFHDDLADGFALDDTAKASIQVKAYTDNTKATEIALAADDDYTVSYTTTDAGCDFEVVFENINDIAGVTKDTVFEVTYQAKLTEAAVLRNLNTVTLEYSNDPYNEDSTGTTSDAAAVYTYKLVIDKKAESETGADLAGAGFTLFKMVGGNEEQIGEELYSNGTLIQFTWNGLDDGTYVLKETKVPAGYNKMADLTFTVEAEHNFDEVTTLAADTMDTTPTTGLITDVVVNNSGTVLPETGAAGTMWLIIGGAVLVMLAGVFMITRKKMSVYAD